MDLGLHSPAGATTCVLVTGATGNIGKHLVARLSGLAIPVHALCRGPAEGFKHTPGVSVFQGDIRDQPAVIAAARGCTHAIHLAVYQNVNDPLPETYNDINVRGTQIVLESLKIAGVPRVVNVSSIVVFESTGSHERDEDWGLKTEFGHNHYARTKYEALLAARAASSQMSLVSVFPTTVMDIASLSSQAPPPAGLLQTFFWRWVGGGIPGGLISRIGTGRRIMNYVDVHDVVDGLIGAAFHGKAGSEYILGGENITVREYLRRCASRLNRRLWPFRIPFFLIQIWARMGRILPVPPVVNLLSNTGMTDLCFSSDRATKDFGYKAVTRV